MYTYRLQADSRCPRWTWDRLYRLLPARPKRIGRLHVPYLDRRCQRCMRRKCPVTTGRQGYDASLCRPSRTAPLLRLPWKTLPQAANIDIRIDVVCKLSFFRDLGKARASACPTALDDSASVNGNTNCHILTQILVQERPVPNASAPGLKGTSIRLGSRCRLAFLPQPGLFPPMDQLHLLGYSSG